MHLERIVGEFEAKRSFFVNRIFRCNAKASRELTGSVSSFTRSSSRLTEHTNRFAVNHKMLNYTNINPITPQTRLTWRPKEDEGAKGIGKSRDGSFGRNKSSWNMSPCEETRKLSIAGYRVSWTNLVI